MEGGEAQAASGKESDVHLPLLGPRESSGLSDRTWRQGWLEEKGSGGGARLAGLGEGGSCPLLQIKCWGLSPRRKQRFRVG